MTSDLLYERRERFRDSEEYYKLAIAQFDGLANDCGLMDSNLARDHAGRNI
jgi:hypothetical protein